MKLLSGSVLALSLLFSVAQSQTPEPVVEDDIFNFRFLVAEDNNKEEETTNQTSELQIAAPPAEVTQIIDPVVPQFQNGNVTSDIDLNAVELVQVVAEDSIQGYGEYADALVNCTDIVPQEQIDSGFENCSEIIDSLNSFQNIGLDFPLCQSEVVWRWGYCQKTCGLCQECEDLPYPGVDLECNNVESVGLCEAMNIYQNATYCARSCQTCEVLAERQGGSGCSNAKSVQCDADSLLKFKSTMSQSAQDDLYSWIAGSNPCLDNWKGISCNEDDLRVTKLQLGDYIRSQKTCSCWPQQIDCPQDECHKYFNAAGTVVDTMFQFQESNNTYVSGMQTSIPSSISQMVYLEALELVGSDITGQIPIEISMLSRMQHLVLFDNKINGTIPPQFSALSSMQQELHLGSNELTGTIPKEISLLDKLWGLYLTDNYLSGTVPVEVTELGFRLYALNMESQQDEKLCIANTTAEYLEGQVQMETDVGQLAIC
eukprot:TRINITY_DN4708_c0_g1_i2.p1 TRINITY_DN4708_c0_g1~~TRINITY_DN4708_c0_g1_i2.p1  ORF type:complete len:485 (+),score=70.19 TRINITY_DN4708_c0_g1_i2:325-1779(+)